MFKSSLQLFLQKRKRKKKVIFTNGFTVERYSDQLTLPKLPKKELFSTLCTSLLPKLSIAMKNGKKWLKFTTRKIKELLSMKFSTILFFVLIYNQMESGPLIRTYCSGPLIRTYCSKKKKKKTLKIFQLKNNFQRWRDKPPFFFE